MVDRPSINPDDVDSPSTGFGAQGEEPRQTGSALAIDFQHGIITAQRVAVRRSLPAIITSIKEHAAAMGEAYYYSWEVKDKRTGKKSVVEGLTIKGADDLARLYGNCIVDVRVEEFPTHYVFHGRFTDLETGYSLTRPFRQRKRQDIGMKDEGRGEDIVFQIGCSKAQRNIVDHALQSYSDRMVFEAKKGLLGWITANPDQANGYIDRMLETHQIELKRIEVVVGSPRDQWIARDIARVMSTLRSVEEGMIHEKDAFPTGSDVTLVEQENARRAAEPKVTTHDPETGEIDPKATTGKTTSTRKKKGAAADPPATQGEGGPPGPNPPTADENGQPAATVAPDKAKPTDPKPASPPPPPPPAAPTPMAGTGVGLAAGADDDNDLGWVGE